RDHLGHGRQPLRPDRREIDEGGRAQPERPEDVLVTEAIERLTAHLLDELAEQHEAEVAVHALRPDLVLGTLAMDLLVNELLRAAAPDEVETAALLDALDVAKVRPPAGETGAVREQMPKGHVCL